MQALANAVAGLALAAVGGGAPAITLNGVAIDGVTNQRIENCTVIIDARGNIQIEAKGYAVRTAPPADPAQAPRPPSAPPAPVAPDASSADLLTHRYFLVSEQTRADGTQYDIEVFINSKWIRKIKSDDDQVIAEVTKHLRRGPNKVVLVATKRAGAERRSSSEDVVFKVTLGEGNVSGDSVTIDQPLVQMRRSAAESENFTQEYDLLAR